MNTPSAGDPRWYSWNPGGQLAFAPYAEIGVNSSGVSRERRTSACPVLILLSANAFSSASIYRNVRA